MYTTNFSCHALRKKHTQQLGFTAAVAISFMVAWLVFLVGKLSHKLGPGMKNLDLYFLGATIGFTALVFAIYFSKRFRVQITGANDKLTIEIKDPALPEARIIESPFSMRRQWFGMRTTRELEMKILYVTVMDPEGHPLVTFSTALGAAYPAPHGFEFIDVKNPEERAQLSEAPLLYETGKTLRIEEELRIYLNFITNRNKKKNQ